MTINPLLTSGQLLVQFIDSGFIVKALYFYLDISAKWIPTNKPSLIGTMKVVVVLLLIVCRLDTFDLPTKCTKLSDLKDGIILAQVLNEM